MLINSIKKVAPFTNESSNMVRLSFSKDALVINAEDYDFGIGATDAFNVDYKGDDIAFGMKSSGLLKSLQIMKTDNLFMEFTDDSHAVTLTYESPDENDQVDILLMPMLLNN
jgi:DNA polymerase-3 subunit beta